jgi:hypothetical protein
MRKGQALSAALLFSRYIIPPVSSKVLDSAPETDLEETRMGDFIGDFLGPEGCSERLLYGGG